ncbi:MAG: hypothetical protein OXH64_01600 [Rhodospirillaceae bacterium]|nr:hypothetical protein [Rhodospirillaceae bacterium]
MSARHHVFRSDEDYDPADGGGFEFAGTFSTAASALEYAGRLLDSGRAVQIEPDLPSIGEAAE